MAKGLHQIWYSQTEKALLSESRVAWLGSVEFWIPSPRGVDASFPVSLWAMQPTSGKHKILELLFMVLPAVFLAHLNTLSFSLLSENLFLLNIFAFFPYGGLASDTLGKRAYLYISWDTESVLCLISALLQHLWLSP